METNNANDTIATQVKIEDVSKKSVLRNFQKTHSIISSDSGGSVQYENDNDEDEIAPNPQIQSLKIGDDFYISSEDESSNHNFDLKRTKELDRNLKEESKFNMSGKNRKEFLHQNDSTLSQQIDANDQDSSQKRSSINSNDLNSSHKRNSASDLQFKPKLNDVMHDDWFFTEVDSQKLKIQQNLKSKSFPISKPINESPQ